MDEAEILRDEIQRRMEASTGNKGGGTQLSGADELKKFAELRDQGVITEEDFQAKKNQLLGL